MKSVEFFLQIVKDDFVLVGANPESRLTSILPALLNRMRDSGIGMDPQEYKVLIARQVLDFNTSLEDSLTSLQDLQIQTGDYLLLVQPSEARVKLNIYTENEQNSWIITHQEALIGRKDEEKNILPEVDLTTALKKPLKVSRQLAIVREVDSKWMIELHPAASSGLFVDQVRLERGRPQELKDEAVLSLGNELQNPSLKLYVRLVS